MAAQPLTGSFPSKPLVKQSRTPSSSLSLSSLESKLFGLRLSKRTKPDFARITLFLTSRSSITARYGGGSRSSGSDDRRSRQSDSDDEKALDISAIRSPTVRLIDQQHIMVGVVSKLEAIQMAEDAELDLVILSPDDDPPVVKIMDYRFSPLRIYVLMQVSFVLASRMDLKELKMGYNIDQHDYSVRLKSARKFLEDGDKVKVIVNLKGRENEFRNMAIELIRRFQSDIGELAAEESKNLSDRNMFIILVPSKAVLQKARDPPKKREKSSANEVSAANARALAFEILNVFGFRVELSFDFN
ncbi:hypothetical protein CDL15_Pgr015263 [Punica granatum]|uniref:Translation initiation factor IF-3 n=1 Tax=Punica granatum TaxID=22663 RepID=A0A218W047_PUNGR|nr:hypothetical protein CDL15_Pgr015263 [Punica granatum]